MQCHSDCAFTELLKNTATGLHNILLKRKQGHQCQKKMVEEAKTSVMKCGYVERSIEVN